MFPIRQSYGEIVVNFEEVATLAMGLPEVTEGTSFRHRTWFVAGKGFAWERPFSKADIKRFGDETPPAGPILAVRVADQNEKDAALAANPKSVFTIEHFDGFNAVLIQLDKATKQVVRDAVIDAWLACAPRKLADAYLADRPSQ